MAGIELNTEQQDLAGIKNFTDILEDYTAVYFPDNESEALALAALENFNWANATEVEAMAWLRKRRRLCLAILRKANLFGYVGSPALGNADALNEAMEQEEKV